MQTKIKIPSYIKCQIQTTHAQANNNTVKTIDKKQQQRL